MKCRCVGLLLVLAWSLSGQDIDVSSVCPQFKPVLDGPTSRKVATVDFTTLRGEVTQLGRMLAEEVSIAMTKCGGAYSMVDRTYVSRLLREHSTFSDVSDAQVLKQLGKLSGADVLLTGSYTMLAETVRVYAKAIDANSTRILTATTIEMPKTPSMVTADGALVVTAQELQPLPGRAKRRRLAVLVLRPSGYQGDVQPAAEAVRNRMAAFFQNDFDVVVAPREFYSASDLLRSVDHEWKPGKPDVVVVATIQVQHEAHDTTKVIFTRKVVEVSAQVSLEMLRTSDGVIVGRGGGSVKGNDSLPTFQSPSVYQDIRNSQIRLEKQVVESALVAAMRSFSEGR